MKKTICIIILSMVFTLASIVKVDASYDGEEAAKYAIKYADDENSWYATYEKDCTNFVSQCLHAGGLSKSSYANKDFGINNESSAWYHARYKRWNTFFGIKYNERIDWKVSTTWVRVYNTGSGKGLYQYLTDTKGYTVIVTSNFNDVVKNAEVGDVIQCQINGNTKSHSAIVTSKRESDIGVTYHSTNRNDVSFKTSLWKAYDKFYIIKVK